MGKTRPSSDVGITGEELEDCATLVLVVKPRTLMDVGYLVLPPGVGLGDLSIDSDIKDVRSHPDPDSFGMCVVRSRIGAGRAGGVRLQTLSRARCWL